MSSTELIVVAFGLFIGYWLVSKLMAGKPEAPPPSAAPWHEALGVAPEASVEEIRAAYARLMSENHPDKEKSENITRAYREAMRLRGVET